MRRHARATGGWAVMLAAGAVLSLAGFAAGQEAGQEAGKGAEPAAEAAPAPEVDPRTLQEMERDLRKLRAKYLGTMRNREIRQVGIEKLREFTDPIIYPELLEVFEHEQEDVRTAVLDHLFDLKNEQADATLAWAAMHDKKAWFREGAAARLVRRTTEVGEVPMRAQWAIADGLKRGGSELDAAANLAATLKLYEAIPMLINGQIGGSNIGGGGGGGGTGGALGEILIAQQVAFVSDLQPVVGESAVAFDPELSVLTNGVYLRVTDASVITYRTEVNAALTRLADAGWDGRSTRSMGYDNARWREWYVNEFLPYRAKVEAEARAKAGTAPAGPK